MLKKFFWQLEKPQKNSTAAAGVSSRFPISDVFDFLIFNIHFI